MKPYYYALSALFLGMGCRAGTQAPAPKTQPTTTETTTKVAPPTTGTKTEVPTPEPATPELPVEGRALVISDGKESFIDAKAATRSGYTVVDFSDDFVPFIFAEHLSADGQPLQNRYRRVYEGLANDTLDEDGEPLPAGTKNYLELYGIPPSLSVLRERFLADEHHACHANIDQQKLEMVETVTYVAPDKMKAEAVKMDRLRRELDDARAKLKATSLVDLAEKDPTLAPKVKAYERRQSEQVALSEVEKRLTCEGMWPKGVKHQTGVYDEAIRLAVRRFQQKNMVYEGNYLRAKTMDALARPPIENDHQALLRVLRERVVAAAGILEDGTTDGKNGPPTFTDKAGKTQPLRNLVEEFSQAFVTQAGLDTPEKALAFFKRHPAQDFKRMQVATRLPALPEYYGPDMDLSIVIDRGEVWYDLPWDSKGTRHPQPRKRYPSFHVNLKYLGQKIPLARWRTTVGGWRAEQASDGYEYFRYKGSDVGPRVIRNIVAGPVWIAPESTPIRALVKMKSVNGAWQRAVNYDELGPGYLSAYGLVAGYFVVPGKNGKPDWDNGIRAHGSSDYLSIYSSEGFSHGCHRLPNHLAIRLYSFILRHRTIRVLGDQGMGFARQFLQGEDVFEIRLPSRGFQYQLEPPLPVDVLEGEIKGTLKTPVPTYVPKPGINYPGPPPALSNSPEAREAGGRGGEE